MLQLVMEMVPTSLATMVLLDFIIAGVRLHYFGHG
jgi:hypothetical protein